MSRELALQQTEWDLHENPAPFVPLDFTEEIKPVLFGLETSKANEMVSGLSTTLAERQVLKNAYIDVIELPITTETLPVFKDLRLKLVKNRTSIEKWHKTNKAFYLAGGRFVDAVKNKEIAENQELEAKLMEAEKFFENQEKEKARLLNLERIEKARPWVQDSDTMNFSDFSEEDFDDYLLGKKTRFENEQKERKAEALKIKKEQLQVVENNRRQLAIAPYLQFLNKVVSEIFNLSLIDFEKLLVDCQNAKIDYDNKQAEIAKENEKLKADAENKEKALAKEKAIQDEKDLAIENERKAEKAKSDAVARQLQDKIDAENAVIAKAKADAERIEKAGVEEQLKHWVDSFILIAPNNLLDNITANEILTKFWAFKYWAKKQI